MCIGLAGQKKEQLPGQFPSTRNPGTDRARDRTVIGRGSEGKCLVNLAPQSHSMIFSSLRYRRHGPRHDTSHFNDMKKGKMSASMCFSG